MTTRVNLRKSPYQVYCGRPNKYSKELRFGNPFVIGKDGDLPTVVEKHKNWLANGESYGSVEATLERRQWVLDNIYLLKDKVCGCFCDLGKPCHVENLINRLHGNENI